TYCYRFLLSSLLLTVTYHIASAQRLRKADKAIINELARHEDYLSVKNTAAAGGRLGEYISREFQKGGIAPGGEAGSFYRSYTVPDGVESASRSFLFINGEAIPYGD